MILKIIIFLSLLSLYSGSESSCYWNNNCAYQYFGSKTPYEAIRGDLRDTKRVEGCQAVSLWSLHRHGNRNPGGSVTIAMKAISGLKDQIVAAFDAGRSSLCAQDIESLRTWTWNETLDNTVNALTGFGYEELYDIGTRVRTSYPELMDGSPSDYYFRPTDEQRTAMSAVAFVHGVSDGTNLTLTIDDPQEIEDVVRPYKNCERYDQILDNNTLQDRETAALEHSEVYQAVKTAVQNRLGITYQINTDELFALYELCRFYRSWDFRFRTPWCAVFSDEDLKVLEYKDDIKHYYKNGYGYWINPRLGELPLKNLYESIEAATQGRGKKMISYFSHDTMMQMTFCALGLNKDSTPLRGDHIDPNRRWKTSFQAPKAINLIAVLNSCQESNTQTYRVQIFIGEKVTEICPAEGCTWDEFQRKFQPYTNASLDICSLAYPEPEGVELPNSGMLLKTSWVVLGLVVSLFNL